MLPLPVTEEETIFEVCCGKRICNGCIYKQMIMKRDQGVPNHEIRELKCFYCCQPTPRGKNDIKALKKLMKKNNTYAFLLMATHHQSGDKVMQSNTKALEMRIAVELGNAQAYTLIAAHYRDGNVVETNRPRAFEYPKEY